VAPVTHAAPPAAAPSAHPRIRPSAEAPEVGPLTLDRLRALWPTIIAHARSTSPLLGTLLADTEVTLVDYGAVTITSAGHAEGIEHKRDVLGKLVGQYVSQPVRIHVTGTGKGEGGSVSAVPAAPRPARLTAETANAERLKALRAKDPTLNAVIEALDLELLE
ncbi:MAG: hypothetical protein HYS40_05050, partial [Gemmatimonadetes bacterium]|nr:hypothetical protein [Gemmatimonadota bacterium]